MLKYIAVVSCLIVEYCVQTNGQSSVGSNSDIANIMRDLTSLRSLLLRANQNIYTLQSQLSTANQNIHMLQSQLAVASKDISSLKQETSQCKTEIDELKQNQTHLRFELKSEIDDINENFTALRADQSSLLLDVDNIRKLILKTDAKFELVNKTRHESESKIKINSITITNLQQKFDRYDNRVNIMNATIKQQQRQQEQQWSNLSSLSSSLASLQLPGKDNFVLYVFKVCRQSREYFFVVVLSFFRLIFFLSPYLRSEISLPFFNGSSHIRSLNRW